MDCSENADERVFSNDLQFIIAESILEAISLLGAQYLIKPKPFGPALADNLDVVRSVAFSSDGRTLAIGVDDGTIRMWNIAHPSNPKPLGHP